MKLILVPIPFSCTPTNHKDRCWVLPDISDSTRNQQDFRHRAFAEPPLALPGVLYARPGSLRASSLSSQRGLWAAVRYADRMCHI
jgi:hypothetical protein